MGCIELFLTALGLAMDAFAVSLCQGLGMKRLSLKDAAIVALYFGFFQALMPVLGWLLGTQFESYITSVDHWIAFVLLAFIGGQMIIGGIKGKDEAPCEFKLDHKALFLMAIATSLDALAVGITLAFLRVDILLSAAVIGVVTFAVCIAGVALGHRFGLRFKKQAEILGGTVLCLIGLKILLEHLGVISF